jgi:hypothetical protein
VDVIDRTTNNAQRRGVYLQILDLEHLKLLAEAVVPAMATVESRPGGC